MIRPLTFIETVQFTSLFVVKYKDRMENGILKLRDVEEGEEAPTDLPILKEWKSARALLAKIRNGAAPLFEDKVPELGRVWIETLPPESGTPWTLESGDYADEHHRVRVCLIPAPDAYTCSGGDRVLINVGVVTLINHKTLCSEINLGSYPRTHLIVDVRQPDV